MRMAFTTGSWLALAALGLSACAEEPVEAAAPSPAAALGDPCSALIPCAGALLCVDGLCTDRGVLREAQPEEPDSWSYFDVREDEPTDIGEEVDSDVGDAPADAPADALADALEDTEVGPDSDGSVSDVPDQELGPDSQAGDVTAPPDDGIDDVKAETDTAPEKQLILLKEDTVENGSGDTFFLLNDGEAWVGDLSTPVAGQLKYAEVILADVWATESCGRFRLAVWSPDDNGLLPDVPTHVEIEEHLLAGGGEGQTVPLSVDVFLQPGPFRIGLILEGPCTEDDVSPALVSDDSGVVGASWLWIPVDGTPPWVPASVFGVDGRWGIRGILETEQALQP